MVAKMVDPSGYLDHCISEQELGKRHSFSCDHPDEDVHFSRILPMEAHHQQTASQLPPNQYNSYQPLSIDSYHLNDSLNYPHFYSQQQPLESEQVKSNKLLQYIGSRLRRGSSFLEAPKLVGQYLLGITIQSWAEFFNTTRFVKPPSNRHLLARRLLTNLSHFQGNYLCVSLVLVIYCILTSPLLLLAIIAYLVALYLVTARSATGRPLRILRYWPNLQQQYSFITLIALPLLWVAGAPSAFFWVIGASFVVVGFHASLYNNTKEQVQSIVCSQPELKVQLSHHRLSTSSVSQHLHIPAAEVAASGESLPPVGKSFVDNNASYASVLSHWISFGNLHGTSSRNIKSQQSTRHELTTGDKQHPTQHHDSSRVTEVTIISQDFAGLGRVYEI